MDLDNLKALLVTHGDEAAGLITAGLALTQELTQALAQARPGADPRTIFTGIPDADKALAQAAGVAEIAGDHGVQIEDVIAVAKVLLSIGLVFI